MSQQRSLKGEEPAPRDRSNRRGQEGGFTVTELMVAVSLMSLIVFALYAMFNQTQKAMRANEAQVDSTERGRRVGVMSFEELGLGLAEETRGPTDGLDLAIGRALEPHPGRLGGSCSCVEQDDETEDEQRGHAGRPRFTYEQRSHRTSLEKRGGLDSATRKTDASPRW